jgi:hypothetical protein
MAGAGDAQAAAGMHHSTSASLPGGQSVSSRAETSGFARLRQSFDVKAEKAQGTDSTRLCPWAQHSRRKNCNMTLHYITIAKSLHDLCAQKPALLHCGRRHAAGRRHPLNS